MRTRAPEDRPPISPEAEHHVEASAQLLDLLRASTPLVQCLTNSVVIGFTANVLLAVGASPAMVDLPDEAGPFARVASGVLVNLGTPQAAQREAMREAVVAATEAGTPWVLDPVAIGSLPVRTALAEMLLGHRPTVIRGNASEVLALAGLGAGGRGTDSSETPDAALTAATGLAGTAGSVVAVSGPVDVITDGSTVIRVHTGTELLTRVTGGGCALGAVMAAFASLSDDRLATTVAATSVYTVAAELAAADTSGPGSFAVALLDRLSSLTAEQLRDRSSLTTESAS
ncbi:hydroxyethylthiazole kinase [Frigoribacterium sp. PhB160]|uniref:hydroxyethylthiazole kinase n=1 Tax=Frigoribacterium sp. PhB160 TaxID=2485192 RepID=UPI000F4A5D42|nr:hydroxyethylthiazole kinase [Frigoribacterium sp. PhB160]ROS58226.1 hydroxyethylthiazole kinase [Frigoribacterium sp. PhB160]